MVRKHTDVAERFKFFMESRNLDNATLLEGLGQAITVSSLFSILNGNRKPSKPLAVLIERTWGFRAEFLLEGEGEMWTKTARKPKQGLSEDEQRVLDFMRASVPNARELQQTMEKSELWSALYGRTEKALAVLEDWGSDDTREEFRAYPQLCRDTYRDCLHNAAAFGKLVDQFHKRRVFRLANRFLRRFLYEVPQRNVTAEGFEAIQHIMEPVLNQREREFQKLEFAIQLQKQLLEDIVLQDLPHEQLLTAQSEPTPFRQLSQAFEEAGMEKALELLQQIVPETTFPKLAEVCRELVSS